MAVTTHLRALQAIELAIRTGSLSAAAASLSITPAALGQRIKALEKYLGYDLLVRGRSGIRPTPELEQALAHLSAAFRELHTVTDILDFQRAHEIHVVADTDWAELWLRPRLAGFKAEHPNVQFCVNGTGDVPTRIGDADCEVWFGDARDGVDDDCLFHDYLLPITSPENTQRISATSPGDRLEGFPLLHLDCYSLAPGAIGWPEWVNKHGYRKTAPERGIRYRQLIQALEAVYADAGLIVCGLALVLSQIDAGKLSVPFPLSAGEWSERAYRVNFSSAALQRNQVRPFREWLMQNAKTTTTELTAAINDDRL